MRHMLITTLAMLLATPALAKPHFNVDLGADFSLNGVESARLWGRFQRGIFRAINQGAGPKLLWYTSNKGVEEAPRTINMIGGRRSARLQVISHCNTSWMVLKDDLGNDIREVTGEGYFTLKGKPVFANRTYHVFVLCEGDSVPWHQAITIASGGPRVRGGR